MASASVGILKEGWCEMRYPEMKGYKPAVKSAKTAPPEVRNAFNAPNRQVDRDLGQNAINNYMQQLNQYRGQMAPAPMTRQTPAQIAAGMSPQQLKQMYSTPMARPPARFKDGGDTKSTRPGMVQPPSEAEFMFDSSNKDMRKQLKGMSPHVTEPVYDSAPTPPPKNTKKETVKKAGGGSCYAGGGMTRADGCAQRGKTRCKVY